ncbi:hypothetical protein Val02_49940 [Virgisporangium aliadipatigenens]|uniref:Nitroreductase domain-containing protein n=1 Tax=Virgisporangium aliadipatigenens TaxID=741659 RepID=A0A8J3YPT9_9ACTN|nr:nitroreductase family protein [Virgisporangium aliadipatigenens]GIJ48108.1 hypothetical protein Val02_49940 [Virgisporangium aliadipatigenens]
MTTATMPGWHDLFSTTAVTACLRTAASAPSVHNSQPWRFAVHDSGFAVLLDRSRLLPAIDPDGREAWISVGAALLNLRLAVLARGRTPVLQGGPGVAYVEFGPHAVPDATVRTLVEAIPRRHTARAPFSGTPVPWQVVEELRAAAAVEGARLTPLDPVRRDAVLALTRAADERQRESVAYRRELAEWTANRRGRTDGVPTEAYGCLDADGRLPVRDFGLVRPDRFRRADGYEPRPRLMLLSTPGDDITRWVRAGQALQRVLLTATVRGLSTQPMTQALELPDLRELMVSQDGWYPQVLLRIGYGLPGAATPRRSIATMLTG